MKTVSANVRIERAEAGAGRGEGGKRGKWETGKEDKDEGRMVQGRNGVRPAFKNRTIGQTGEQATLPQCNATSWLSQLTMSWAARTNRTSNSPTITLLWRI